MEDEIQTNWILAVTSLPNAPRMRSSGQWVALAGTRSTRTPVLATPQDVWIR